MPSVIARGRAWPPCPVPCGRAVHRDPSSRHASRSTVLPWKSASALRPPLVGGSSDPFPWLKALQQSPLRSFGNRTAGGWRRPRGLPPAGGRGRCPSRPRRWCAPSRRSVAMAASAAIGLRMKEGSSGAEARPQSGQPREARGINDALLRSLGEYEALLGGGF